VENICNGKEDHSGSSVKLTFMYIVYELYIYIVSGRCSIQIFVEDTIIVIVD